MPPLTADERATLQSWLDFQRATLAVKCAGLTDTQLRTASAPPSPLTLLGLTAHMAEVERNWFRRVLLGQTAPAIFGGDSDPEARDGGFDLPADVSTDTVREAWENEVDHARAACAERTLEDTGTFGGGEVSLRWIYVHMIGEYARHNGHADLLRERIDGATGV
ncbi:DinB family protein [Saccharomonospora saliphila]|uniref:DinB family protein n=1 Tax=Saccharomonospora saliphila TaxID=369829 RepID=UPI0018DBB548|nr:DinB family protein [Saccharomonospora saliphila]